MKFNGRIEARLRHARISAATFPAPHAMAARLQTIIASQDDSRLVTDVDLSSGALQESAPSQCVCSYSFGRMRSPAATQVACTDCHYRHGNRACVADVAFARQERQLCNATVAAYRFYPNPT